MTHTDLAKMILDAQRIYEESWSPKGGRYTISLDNAVVKANASRPESLPKEMEQIVYWLNLLAWNDVQEWAKAALMTDGDAKVKG